MLERPVDDRLLAAVSGLSARAFDRAVAELVLRGVAERTLGGAIALVHGYWQAPVTAAMPASRAQDLHWAAAEALADTPGASDGELADHWAAAGDTLRAAEHLLAAASDAVERAAMASADQRYARYVELAPVTRAAIEARIAWASDVLKATGQYARAAEVLEASVALAEDEGEPELVCRAYRWLGIVRRYAGDVDGAREAFDRAVFVIRAVGRVKAQAAALSSRGNLHMDRGDYDAARADLELALEIATEAEETHEQAIISGNLALLARRRGDLAGAIALQYRARELHAVRGHRYGEGLVHGNLAGLLFLSARPTEAAVHYAEAIAAFRRWATSAFTP